MTKQASAREAGFAKLVVVRDILFRGFQPMGVAAIALGLAIALLPQTQLITAIVVVVALAVVAALFHEPALGLALVMIAGPFQPLERVTLQLPLDSGQIILGLTLLSYLARALAMRRSPITAHSGRTASYQLPITSALIAFIVVCLLSFFPARDFGDWANECIKWLQVLMIALLVMNERDPRKRSVVIGAILLSAAGQAIYGIIQADVRGFGPREFQVLGSKTNFRAYGTFEQPNPFGGYMGLVWPLAAGVALSQMSDVRCQMSDWLRGRSFQSAIGNPKSKIVLAILAGSVATLCLLALIASGSRGGLVGAVVAGAVMGLALLKHPWRWAGAILLIALALLGAHVVSIPLSLDAQVQQIIDIDVRNAHILPTTFSTIERLAHWQAAVRMIEANPWLGVGFGNYGAAYPEFKLFIWDNALGHAHNYYLNIFAETGVIGFLAYLALWLTIAVMTIRIARSKLLAMGNGPIANSQWIALGLLGSFAHLTAHHLFDNLYVANMHLLIGVYLGLVGALWLERKRAAATIIRA